MSTAYVARDRRGSASVAGSYAGESDLSDRTCDHAILAEFNRPKGKIDFMTFRVPANQADAVERCVRDGTVDRPHPRNADTDWLTVHDPSIGDLQALLQHSHQLRIAALEIAVDFTANDLWKSEEACRRLYRFMAKRLFPAKHPLMGGRTMMKQYSNATRKFELVRSRWNDNTPSTVVWQNAKQSAQLRLYIKTLDRRQSHQRVLRVEVTLRQAGCQDLRVDELGLLPRFAKTMRRDLLPFFHVARGVKTNTSRVRGAKQSRALERLRTNARQQQVAARGWDRLGAQWAATRGQSVLPDATANRLFGGALKGLQTKLLRLRLPEKVADAAEYEQQAIERFDVFDGPAPVYRREQHHLLDLLDAHPCLVNRKKPRASQADQTR